MIAMGSLLALVWVHFVADFLLQTDTMALNKSKSLYWLTVHVGVYSICFLPFGWRFAGLNFAAHFLTDFVSSRMTAALWKAQRRHAFFAVIGFDQALHLTVLVASYPLLSGGFP